jgi:hypothetical protein
MSKPEQEVKLAASIVSRVMGLILGSVATANVLARIEEYFSL